MGLQQHTISHIPSSLPKQHNLSTTNDRENDFNADEEIEFQSFDEAEYSVEEYEGMESFTRNQEWYRLSLNNANRSITPNEQSIYWHNYGVIEDEETSEFYNNEIRRLHRLEEGEEEEEQQNNELDNQSQVDEDDYQTSNQSEEAQDYELIGQVSRNQLIRNRLTSDWSNHDTTSDEECDEKIEMHDREENYEREENHTQVNEMDNQGQAEKDEDECSMCSCGEMHSETSEYPTRRAARREQSESENGTNELDFNQIRNYEEENIDTIDYGEIDFEASFVEQNIEEEEEEEEEESNHDIDETESQYRNQSETNSLTAVRGTDTYSNSTFDLLHEVDSYNNGSHQDRLDFISDFDRFRNHSRDAIAMNSRQMPDWPSRNMTNSNVSNLRDKIRSHTFKNYEIIER